MQRGFGLVEIYRCKVPLARYKNGSLGIAVVEPLPQKNPESHKIKNFLDKRLLF
jgi:hypothetical protein